jgi:hypothetical protein
MMTAWHRGVTPSAKCERFQTQAVKQGNNLFMTPTHPAAAANLNVPFKLRLCHPITSAPARHIMVNSAARLELKQGRNLNILGLTAFPSPTAIVRQRNSNLLSSVRLTPILSGKKRKIKPSQHP